MKKILFFALAALFFSSAHAQSDSQFQLTLQVAQLEERLANLEHKFNFLQDRYDTDFYFIEVSEMTKQLSDPNANSTTKKKCLDYFENIDDFFAVLSKKVAKNSIIYHYTDEEKAILDNTINAMRSMIDIARDNN